jgi:hypothetical protein
MGLLEDIFVNVAVLVISGASAVAIGHFFLSVVVKDRRSSLPVLASSLPSISPITSSSP